MCRAAASETLPLRRDLRVDELVVPPARAGAHELDAGGCELLEAISSVGRLPSERRRSRDPDREELLPPTSEHRSAQASLAPSVSPRQYGISASKRVPAPVGLSSVERPAERLDAVGEPAQAAALGVRPAGAVVGDLDVERRARRRSR